MTRLQPGLWRWSAGRPPERPWFASTFQSWPIPSGGGYAGIIRHPRPTRDDKLLIRQGSTSPIILVTPHRAATQWGRRAGEAGNDRGRSG